MPPKEKYSDPKLRDQIKDELEDGTRQRYLPKNAWEQMNEKEKQQTDEKKRKESEKGKQFVADTGKARQARKNVSEQDQNGESPRRSARNQGKKSDNAAQEESASTKAGQKRGRGKKDEGTDQDVPASKSKKSDGTLGSKNDKADAPAQHASLSRLPKKGQLAYWKAMPGWVDGKVLEVLTSDKKVDGKDVKASKDDPRIVLKSNAKSGKICVHKVDNVFFD